VDENDDSSGVDCARGRSGEGEGDEVDGGNADGGQFSLSTIVICAAAAGYAFSAAFSAASPAA